MSGGDLGDELGVQDVEVAYTLKSVAKCLMKLEQADEAGSVSGKQRSFNES